MEMDRQFKLKYLWNNACYKKRDAYMILPTGPRFTGGSEVAFGVRIRFNFDPWTMTKIFTDWKKVTQKQLLEFYDYASKHWEEFKKEVEKNKIKDEIAVQ
jgi:hypothetical protein